MTRSIGLGQRFGVVSAGTSFQRGAVLGLETWLSVSARVPGIVGVGSYKATGLTYSFLFIL